MLDREGYRPNVGIILTNERNEVFWGKRVREHSWQFPQGGIKPGESPEAAMYRELLEEVGLLPHHVKILGRTRDWLRYDVPTHWVKREWRGSYRGQKQIWYLLRLIGRESDVHLRATSHPEFDAWRWHEYWVPLEAVVEFKRGVYEMALIELARFLPRQEPRNRYLRSGMRTRDHDNAGVCMYRAGQLLLHHGVELPPGASFDPDPQTSYNSHSSDDMASPLDYGAPADNALGMLDVLNAPLPKE